MMSLWDALRMNMMISYQELVRTFLSIHKMTDSIAASPFELLQTLGQRMITVSF